MREGRPENKRRMDREGIERKKMENVECIW
jgi:hypothetical protein